MTIRLYPNFRQVARFEHFLEVGRTLFNHALEQRKSAYEHDKSSLRYREQTGDLTVLRAVSPVLRDVPARIERDAMRRVDLAFQYFFRRVKSGEVRAGFPRFKSWQRWNSFSISEPGKCVRGNRIRVSGVNGLIVARNIQYERGQIKVQRIVRRAGKWYCQLVVEDGVSLPPPVPVVSEVGIDVGLKTFATLSTGETVENPRFYRKAERKLAHTQRSVCRKVEGGRNLRKAILRLQRVHERIADLRSNFTHHASKEIVSKHQFIAIEDLNVAGMSRSRFGKSILDAAWSQFTYRLTYKAERAGGVVVRVNPAGTSQECSRCGATVPKTLSVRVHDCQECGLVIDRDVNAARNVLRRAVELRATPGAGRAIGNACGAVGCAPNETGSPA